MPLCLILNTHLFLMHLQFGDIRLSCIFHHTCCLFVVELLVNRFLPFSLRSFVWMVPGFVECLRLIQTWLGITCYHGQKIKKFKVLLILFSWAICSTIFLTSLLYKACSYFIACTTLALIVISGVTLTCSLISSTKHFLQLHHPHFCFLKHELHYNYHYVN